MEPDLEVVQVRPSKSFSTMCHGYPYRHLLRGTFTPSSSCTRWWRPRAAISSATSSASSIAGTSCSPGRTLPHNWISDVPPGEIGPSAAGSSSSTEMFVDRVIKDLPEMGAISRLLALRGAAYCFGRRPAGRSSRSRRARRRPGRVGGSSSSWRSWTPLSREQRLRVLASESDLPDPSGFMSTGINKALAYIREHLTEPFSEPTSPGSRRRSPSAFASFRRELHRHVAAPVHPPAAYQPRLPVLMSDERSTSRDSLRGSASTICRISTGSSWRRRACLRRGSDVWWPTISRRPAPHEQGGTERGPDIGDNESLRATRRSGGRVGHKIAGTVRAGRSNASGTAFDRHASDHEAATGDDAVRPRQPRMWRKRHERFSWNTGRRPPPLRPLSWDRFGAAAPATFPTRRSPS